MIAEIAMGRIRSQLLERYNATLTYPKKVLEALVSQYNDPGTGGRAIEQALSRKVLPQLGQQCLDKLIEGDQFSTVAISLGKDRSTIEIKVT
jgi:ATP-dependent Clp protease ATP-binding subunit ClpA